MYRYNGSSWTQLGSTITDSGSGTTDFGWNVKISADGNTFIIGASNLASANNGQFASVYRYDSSNGWVLSQKFTGTSAFGTGVDITPDGNTVVISACPYGVTNGIHYSEVHEYNTTTSSWSQKGSAIVESDPELTLGMSVSISSDGNRFVIGGGRFTSKVYEYASSSWSQLGINLSGNGSYTNEVRISADGNTVGRHVHYGASTIFIWEYTTDWNQISQTSNFTTNTVYERFDMSEDALTVAARGHKNVGDFVEVHQYSNGSWTQVGSDITAEVAGDKIGYNCALSANGKQLAVTARFNDGGGTDSGHVRVYTIEGSASPYVVTVVNGVFNIDGDAQPSLTFTSGTTYVFDQSDTSNTGHPLVIGTTADNSGSLVSYQTVVGTPGLPGAYTSFTATADTVYYFCYYHPGMGA